MQISTFSSLPNEMHNEIVKHYIDILSSKKATLFWKRFFDVFVCGIVAIIASPFLLIFAILIKLTSKGEVFFKQERIGKDMKPFRILKFRTMVTNAEQQGAQLTTGNDARITGFGKFLRAINMDEMPQLFNVLKGEMSIIGTRPEVKRYVDAYSEEMYATLLLPPGMLSLASVKYKNENAMLSDTNNPERVYVEKILPDKMKYNLEYLEKISIKEDIKLIGKSVACMFTRK